MNKTSSHAAVEPSATGTSIYSGNQFSVYVDGSIAWLINSRPERLNAIKNATWSELLDALDAIEKRSDIRVTILTGDGEAFCAGADVGSMLDDVVAIESKEKTVKDLRVIQTNLQNSTRKIRNSSVPVIAAVTGYAVGAGLEMCLACDLVVADTTAIMGFPEVNVGITITNGGTFFLSKVVGLNKARELAYTGEFVDANEAFRIGLINKLVEPGSVRAQAKKLADRIASRAPVAITLHKRLLDSAAQSSLETALTFETEGLITTARTDDHVEGAKAFIEKRLPQFEGR